MLNVINGGAHAENSIDLQEFMLVPAGAADLRGGAAHRRGGLPRAQEAARTSAGSRPASATRAASRPTSPPARRRSRRCSRPRERAGHRERVAIALDPAATELYRDGRYRFEGREEDGDGHGAVLGRSSPPGYPIVSIEDGLAEDDWAAWRALTEGLGERLQLVGDDLFVTNAERLRRGIDEGVANAILVKVNQIGTLTETLDAIELARRSGYGGRHLAPLRRDRGHDDRRPRGRHEQPARSRPARRRARDRVAKYNQLLRIEEELGDRAAYPGWDAFPRAEHDD